MTWQIGAFGPRGSAFYSTGMQRGRHRTLAQRTESDSRNPWDGLADGHSSCTRDLARTEVNRNYKSHLRPDFRRLGGSEPYHIVAPSSKAKTKSWATGIVRSRLRLRGPRSGTHRGLFHARWAHWRCRRPVTEMKETGRTAGNRALDRGNSRDSKTSNLTRINA
jgi:hypothetical protein